MKKLYFMCLLAFLGCGGGGDDLTPVADIVTDPSNFSGTFTYVDDDCGYYLMNQFTITQFTDGSLTMVIDDAGASGLTNGDAYTGAVSYEDGTYYGDFSDSLYCYGTYIVDQEQADLYNDYYTGINFLPGDLAVYCEDSSYADGYCIGDYQLQ